MNYFTIQIYSDQWNIYIISDGDNVIADEDSAAETDFQKKEVYFRRGDLSLADVNHEIFHMFFGYTYTRTANLDHGQTEEVAAELFALRGKDMLKLAEELYEKLKTMRDVEDAK